MDVTCTSERDLTPCQAGEILLLQHLAYPDTPHFALRRWCHSPLDGDDLWFTFHRQGQLLGSLRLLHRRAKTAGGEMVLGGIGNVCSHPDARGQGAARACMQAAAEYMRNSGKIDFGMLFCGRRVVEFYGKLGWRQISDQVQRSPEAGGSEPVGGFVMICPARLGLGDWPAGPVDLNGDDW